MFLGIEFGIPLVLTNQSRLVLDYSERYLVVNGIYGEILEDAVLDIVSNSLVVSRRNETSLTQKWQISSAGMGITL